MRAMDNLHLKCNTRRRASPLRRRRLTCVVCSWTPARSAAARSPSWAQTRDTGSSRPGRRLPRRRRRRKRPRPQLQVGGRNKSAGRFTVAVVAAYRTPSVCSSTYVPSSIFLLVWRSDNVDNVCPFCRAGRSYLSRTYVSKRASGYQV